jgi:hypothetical protein
VKIEGHVCVLFVCFISETTDRMAIKFYMRGGVYTENCRVNLSLGRVKYGGNKYEKKTQSNLLMF